jgi:hypothetical protein
MVNNNNCKGTGLQNDSSSFRLHYCILLISLKDIKLFCQTQLTRKWKSHAYR